MPRALKVAQGIILHFYYLPDAGIQACSCYVVSHFQGKASNFKGMLLALNIFNDALFLDFIYNITPVK